MVRFDTITGTISAMHEKGGGDTMRYLGFVAIKTVSRAEFQQMLTNAAYKSYDYLKEIIMPIALLVGGASIIMILIGSLLHSSTSRKAGTLGLLITFATVLLFFALPALLGVLQTIGNEFTK